MTTFEELELRAEMPSLARTVTREEVAAYAEASGDDNLLHLEDEVARAAGFDGIIAHGMLTMGHMAACVVGWAGEGAEVRRISATFRSPVAVGETIVAGGRVRALDPDRREATVETWVSVHRGDREAFPIKRGEALVRFP